MASKLRVRAPLTVVMVAAGVVLPGCGENSANDAHRVVAFRSAYVSKGTDDRNLQLLTGPTYRSCSTTADESPTTVRVTLKCRKTGATSAGCEDRLPDCTAIRLREPLGSRKLIDASSGREVVACRSPLAPTSDGNRCVRVGNAAL